MNLNQKPGPRDIVVKGLLNADEYIDFAKECEASDISHSKAVRDLVRGWVNSKRNVKRELPPMEWPGAGQNMAMFPSRRLYGTPRVHMRL